MVATRVLEARVERRTSSSLVLSTNLLALQFGRKEHGFFFDKSDFGQNAVVFKCRLTAFQN